MKVPAFVLTGGSSRRMGSDKASLEVEGVPQAVRIARSLEGAGFLVAALGPTIEGFPHFPDSEPGAGPLLAIANLAVEQPFFLVSCDLPCFDGASALRLVNSLGEYQAAVPTLGGKAQPLCAAYAPAVVGVATRLVSSGERRVMAWMGALYVRFLAEDDLRGLGIDAETLCNANTPEEFTRLCQKTRSAFRASP